MAHDQLVPIHNTNMYNQTLIRPNDGFDALVYVVPMPHDEMACTALSEYELYCRTEEEAGRKPRMHMNEFAKMYHTTIENMKKHWGCVDKSVTAYMKYG